MTEPSKPEETKKVDTAKAVDPNADKAEAGSPIFDELNAKHEEPLPVEEAEAVSADAPDSANSYKVDVKRALERETQDGPGDDEPGPSDFQGFATDGVEKETSE